DQEEAMEVADRGVVMNKGVVEQVGTPDEIYDQPATAFVSRVLGSVNLFHGRVHDGWAQIGGLRQQAPEHVNGSSAPAVAFLRPHEIELSDQADGAIGAATISSIRSVGPLLRLELERDGGEGLVEVELPRERYSA